MIVWVPGDDKRRHLRAFIENLHVFPSCHLHQLPEGSESWVCKLICPVTRCLGNWEGLAKLSRRSSLCKEHCHICQGATMWTKAHLLMKAQSPPCFLGAALLEGLQGVKTYFWATAVTQLTWLWGTCVSRQRFHICAVCFNMSNSWCFCKVFLAPSSLLFSTVSIK